MKMADWLVSLLHCKTGVAKDRRERPIRPCRLFDWHFSHVFLKHNDNGLNFDFCSIFIGKMSLLGLCTLFSKVTLFSLPEVFFGPQICQNALAAPHWGGAHDAPPDSSLIGWGWGHPLPNPNPLSTPSAPRFWLLWPPM